jgi:hypothetical protein
MSYTPNQWGFSGVAKDKSTSMLWTLIVIQILTILQQTICGRNPKAHRCTNTSRLIFILLFLLIASILVALRLRMLCPHPTSLSNSHNKSICPTLSSSTTSSTSSLHGAPSATRPLNPSTIPTILENFMTNKWMCIAFNNRYVSA